MREFAGDVEAADLLRRQHARQKLGDAAPDQQLFVGEAKVVEVTHLVGLRVPAMGVAGVTTRGRERDEAQHREGGHQSNITVPCAT